MGLTIAQGNRPKCVCFEADNFFKAENTLRKPDRVIVLPRGFRSCLSCCVSRGVQELKC